MDKMAQAIAAALRVLNPTGLEPSASAQNAIQEPSADCDKRPDNRDDSPPRAT